MADQTRTNQNDRDDDQNQNRQSARQGNQGSQGQNYQGGQGNSGNQGTQSGQSGDIAAAFGGMGSQTAFGPRGAATVLTKATTWCAIIFMVTSITLSVMASRKKGPGSVLQGVGSSQSAPAKPANPQK